MILLLRFTLNNTADDKFKVNVFAVIIGVALDSVTDKDNPEFKDGFQLSDIAATYRGPAQKISPAQAQFARLFTEMVSLCFEVDEKIFGNMTKQIKGSDDGTPYTLKYIPSRDIKSLLKKR